MEVEVELSDVYPEVLESNYGCDYGGTGTGYDEVEVKKDEDEEKFPSLLLPDISTLPSHGPSQHLHLPYPKASAEHQLHRSARTICCAVFVLTLFITLLALIIILLRPWLPYSLSGSETSSSSQPPNISHEAFARITEFHYDNDGIDVGEFVEVTASQDFDLGSYCIYLINGQDQRKKYASLEYAHIRLSDINHTRVEGHRIVLLAKAEDFEYTTNAQRRSPHPIDGIQNGPNDCIVMADCSYSFIDRSVDSEYLLDAACYEGAILDVNLIPIFDIGVEEDRNLDRNLSLQLDACGWFGPAPSSPGRLNRGRANCTALH